MPNLMNKLSHSLFVLCSVLLAGLPVRAAFDPAIVGEDSRWVVFVDLNAMRGSVLGKQMLEIITKAPPQIGTPAVHLDLPKTLATIGTATAYGTNFSKDPKLLDGVLLLRGTDDLRKIAQGYLAQATITTPDRISELKDKDLPFDAYSIGGQVIVAFPPEPVVLISKSKIQLLKAREVFRGDASSLANAGASPLTNLLPKSGGAFLIAATVMPSEDVFPADAPQARILKMASAASLSIGEDGPQTFAHVELVATSEEMADKLMKIVQGITAMISLTETNDKNLDEFLKSVAIARDGDNITLSLSYPSERIAQMIENAKQQAAARRGNYRPGAVDNGFKSIAQWKADDDGQDAAGGTPVYHTIENVHLSNGSMIMLIGRGEGGHAQIDRVEISPMDGSAPPLRFKAENMTLLRGYYPEAVSTASGGRLITLSRGRGMAQFSFPGDDGTYRLKVRYVSETGETGPKSRFSLMVKDPEPVPAKDAETKPADSNQP